MQSLQYALTGNQTIAVWPDVSSSLDPNLYYEMILSSDYGLQEEVIPLTLVNTPTSVTPRLVFSFSRALLPTFTGNYTIVIRERSGQVAIWGTLSILWKDYDALWSQNLDPGGSPTILDIDRAWVSGSDVPSYKQYTSPNESGAYIIYHN